jgi:hypothetical protein
MRRYHIYICQRVLPRKVCVNGKFTQVSVIPCEVPLIILNPFAFVLYGNRDSMVLLLKIVLVEQVAFLLCICEVQSLRLLILAILMDIVTIFLQYIYTLYSLYMLSYLLFPNLHII